MEKTRAEQIKRLFARENFQALICRAPQHLVMLTGYQSILGNSFCLVSLALLATGIVSVITAALIWRKR